MLEISDTDATSIISFFEELPDPRSEVNRLHLLGDVIVIAIFDHHHRRGRLPEEYRLPDRQW